jgi:hypothetical protein
MFIELRGDKVCVMVKYDSNDQQYSRYKTNLVYTYIPYLCDEMIDISVMYIYIDDRLSEHVQALFSLSLPL